MRLVGKLLWAVWYCCFPCAAQAQYEHAIVTAANQVVTISSQNRPVIGVAVTANTNVTLTPQATVDGTNWATIQACAISTRDMRHQHYLNRIVDDFGSAGQYQVRLLVRRVRRRNTDSNNLHARSNCWRRRWRRIERRRRCCHHRGRRGCCARHHNG